MDCLLNVLIFDGVKTTLPHVLLVPDTFVSNDFHYAASKSKNAKKPLSRMLILLLLLISGNVNMNPGPDLNSESLLHLGTPTDFANRKGLGFLHINTRSLLPKLDSFRTWFMVANPDVVVVSETWLKPSVSDNVIRIDGYNVYRTDRKGRAGGIAIYVSSKFHVSVLLSLSIPRQFELLALQIMVANTPITTIGCYRPPSAVSETLSSLTELLSNLCKSETILLGDLNWDWLSAKSESFMLICESLNLVQLISSPTRINPSKPDSDTLLDLMLTNMAHKHVAVGVFANDISDHCTIACVRNTKLPKSNGLTVLSRCFKHFSDQAFLHDLARLNWDRLKLIPTVDDAVEFFQHHLLAVANKHAPIRKVRCKNGENPWFTKELADLIYARNKQWALARKSKSEVDWELFRNRRNR